VCERGLNGGTPIDPLEFDAATHLGAYHDKTPGNELIDLSDFMKLDVP
jgi:hypothetical protein